MSKLILGKDFIKMIAPILGIDDFDGIRKIEISAPFNDVTVVNVEMLPKESNSDIAVEKTEHAGTYIVSATKINQQTQEK